MPNEPVKEAGALRIHRDEGGGKKPWLWALLALLALLIVGALLWWLLADDDDEDDLETGAAQEEVLDADDPDADATDDEDGADADTDTDSDAVTDTDDADAGGTAGTPGTAASGGTCGDGGTITDVAFFSDADAEDVEGCAVDLTDVRVTSVPSDKLFTVDTGGGVLFVSVGDEPEGPPAEVEGRVDVDEGETVSFVGDTKTIASAAEARATFDIDPQTAEQLASIGYYVLATSVEEQQ